MLNRLSHCFNNIQEHLFPYLRTNLPDFEPHHKKVAQTLALARIEEFIDYSPYYRGRPRKNRGSLARAFLAKASLNIPTTLELINRLRFDHSLRIMCGWDYYDQVPTESTFSRAFSEFAKSNLPEQIHHALTSAIYSDKPVMHLSRDATDIPAREKSKKKKKSRQGKNSGPRAKRGEGVCELQVKSGLGWEELLKKISKECDSGSKVSPKGTQLYWMGYKFHVDVADGGIPVSCILTSASSHDSTLAIPLSKKSAKRAQIMYELMDKGYYVKAIEQYIKDQGRIPLIDHCPKTSVGKKRYQEELKARSTLNWKPAEAIRHGQRTTVERFFSQLKDSYGGRAIRVKGASKVCCHLMFGVIALTVDQLMRMLE